MAAGFLNRFFGPRPKTKPAPELKLFRFRTKAEFDTFQSENRQRLDADFDAECALYKSEEPFSIEAFCYVCGKPSVFDVDFTWPRQIRGRTVPSWKDSAVCRGCKLSNRLRADVQLLDIHANLQPGNWVNLTEQTTQLYKVMKGRHKEVQGNEYLGDSVPFGQENAAGIRNEDITQLTYRDGQFKAVMCFEVLEHVPDFQKALSELLRILQSGGTLLLSVPFIMVRQENTVRARVLPDGTVDHLMEPEYHADPLDPQGCLCYYHFGWDMLDNLRAAGFQDPHVVYYGSRELGYLGHNPVQFIAKKPG